MALSFQNTGCEDMPEYNDLLVVLVHLRDREQAKIQQLFKAAPKFLYYGWLLLPNK